MGRGQAQAARIEKVPQDPLILDSGAIIALSRGDKRARRYLERTTEAQFDVFVSPVAVAETVRGDGPGDASVNRVLNEVDAIPPITETTGRVAGRLLRKAESNSTIDALVVGQAIELGGACILTSDPDDLMALAADEIGVIIRGI